MSVPPRPGGPQLRVKTATGALVRRSSHLASRRAGPWGSMRWALVMATTFPSGAWAKKPVPWCEGVSPRQIKKGWKRMGVLGGGKAAAGMKRRKKRSIIKRPQPWWRFFLSMAVSGGGCYSDYSDFFGLSGGLDESNGYFPSTSFQVHREPSL